MPDVTPEPEPNASQAGDSGSADSLRLRSITSESLLQGQQEVLIAHGPDVYRLRLTRNGKLILQK